MAASIDTPSLLSPLPMPNRSLAQQGGWLSEDPCYMLDRDLQSHGSDHSEEKSTENIALKKSRVCSQENGEALSSLWCNDVHIIDWYEMSECV